MGVMPIPCPHFKITIVKRSQGQSAVAGAAYQSGERLFSEYDQKTKYYNKKKELVHAEIMLPSHAPPGFADRATLWNAVDRENRAYNIEVQRSDRGASEKRARYNSSLLDANLTDAGDDYDALNETYVIFITENDVLKAGLPIYHVERTVQETGTFFNDQAHIVYVNSQIKDETALGKLMHDFFCTNSKDMNYSILAQRVRYFKEDTKGVAAMCRAMEKMRDETEHETSVKHALAMLADGVPCEKVAKYTDLSIEEVRALAEKKSA